MNTTKTTGRLPGLSITTIKGETSRKLVIQQKKSSNSSSIAFMVNSHSARVGIRKNGQHPVIISLNLQGGSLLHVVRLLIVLESVVVWILSLLILMVYTAVVLLTGWHIPKS